jgi:hypothetical protein
MTQQGQEQKVAELTEIFAILDERGQESALAVLRSLEFAQNIMTSEQICCTQPSHNA